MTSLLWSFARANMLVMARMRSHDRRRQLLEVAAEVFSQRGYRGATTAELARAAGITEPILYRHFESKLALFVTLIDEVGAAVITAWKHALREHDDPIERLKVLLQGNPATHERGRGVYRVIFQAMTEMHADPTIHAALKRHIARVHRFLQREITNLQEADVVRQDQTASALAWLLIHVAIGYGMVSPLSISGHDADAPRPEVQHMLRQFLCDE